MEKQDILDSSQRTKGNDALTSNIEAAKALAQILKTTLGPLGRDKMLIDSTGETVITNDGAKILQEMEIEHPGAQLLVEVANSQELEIGDGTTSAILVAGELLAQAQQLISKGIHPTQISKGFEQTSKKTLEIIQKQSQTITPQKKTALKDLSETAMTGKLAEYSKEHLSKLILECVDTLNYSLDKESVSLVKATGASIENSSLVKGIVLDKKRAHPNMPKSIENASILLIQDALEVQELEHSSSISIQNAKEYEEFIQAEKAYLEQLAEKIVNSGADVVISQKGIDDSLAAFLAQQGVMAIRRVKKTDMEKLSNALQTPIKTINESFTHLPKCGNVKSQQFNNEEYISIENCPNPKTITILVRASTKQTLDELERAFEDALGVITTSLSSKAIVAGGGAIELETYKQLEEYAKTLPGKEQLITNHFAESLLTLPQTLCENAGIETIEVMANLHTLHQKGNNKAGLKGEESVSNTMKYAIIEPLSLKEHIIKSATETTNMILRIDDIIAAKQLTQEKDKQY